MSLSKIILRLAKGLFSLAFVFTLSATAGAKRAPNFVLIFMDDQGYQDVGVFGSKTIRTPHLDNLAKEGMKFTDFYSLAPVCSPSRAGLMTGCYPPRVGITGVLFPRHTIGLNPEETTVAEILKTKSYATAAVGKWHIGHLPKFLPTNHGFDSYFGIPYSNDMDGVKGKNRNLDRAWIERDVTPWNVPLLRDTKEIERPVDQNTLTTRYTEEAQKFIYANEDKPFFLYIPHTMPHIPLFVSDKFYTKDPKQAYIRTIEQLDHSIGQILKTLKETGVDSNTLVVFTSDNGPWHLKLRHHGGSALPLRGAKFSTWEGGMRVPTIMRWPGKIPAGSVCGELAAACDILPTFARLAKAKLPKRKIDGKNIWRLMSGKEGAKSPHKAFYFYKGKGLRAVRSGHWKLHISSNNRKEQQSSKKPALTLYNLSKDISETTDVAAENEPIVKRLYNQAQKFDKALKADARPPGEVKTETKG
ncbi:MAG: sulfatase [Verrucomicrobiota bacterium]|nr:sulfatase [Verrucomicrobiota bacterium]